MCFIFHLPGLVIAFSLLENYHTPSCLAAQHGLVSLVDLVQSILVGYQFVQLELAGHIQIQNHREVAPGVGGAVVRPHNALLLPRQKRAGEVGGRSHGRQANQHQCPTGPYRPQSLFLDRRHADGFEHVVRPTPVGQVSNVLYRVIAGHQGVSRTESAGELHLGRHAIHGDDGFRTAPHSAAPCKMFNPAPPQP